MTEHPNYDSPSELKAFLDSKSMSMQKKFGQNFLINGSARKKIAGALDIKKGTTVWEVGPGLGAMTNELLEQGADVTAFEIDRGFCSMLSEFFPLPNFHLVQGDVLKTWENQIELKGIPERFFGNLPYNIAATILASTISQGVRFTKSVVTVQKEVALRMMAKPASADYSSFSVLCQWAYDITPVIDLAGGSFWPKPNVDSRAVLMQKKQDFPRCLNVEHFMKLQRALFVSRRKTVKNNLTQFYSDAKKAEQVLSRAKIDATERAEKLSIEEILNLSDISFSYENNGDF